MAVLEIQNLCKQYENFALQNVTFRVEAGHIVGFMGRNVPRYEQKTLSIT